MANHSGTTTYCYDARGNVIRKRQATPGGFIVDYRYNLADRLIGMTYPRAVGRVSTRRFPTSDLTAE